MFDSNRKPSPSLLLKRHTYSPPRLLLPQAYAGADAGPHSQWAAAAHGLWPVTSGLWPVTLFKPVTCTPHSSAAATHDVVIGILVGLKQLVAAWPTEFVTSPH